MEYTLSNASNDLLTSITKELKSNEGKLSPSFVDEYAQTCSYEYEKVGDSARVCVMTTTTGNKIVGSALVLNPANDVAEIGNKIAREHCQESLWSFLGGIAKLLEPTK